MLTCQAPSLQLLHVDDDKSIAIRRRSAFRLLSELLLVGVYSDTAVLLNVVKHLAALDYRRDRDAAQGALSVLASFAKGCRQDVLGLGQPVLPALSPQTAEQVTHISFFTVGV